MAISYPINLPTAAGIRNIEWSALAVNAVSKSPFTLAQQIMSYQGDAWSATLSLRPMKRNMAEQWVGWLLSLRGHRGSFLLPDPKNTTPRGTASTLTVTGEPGNISVTAALNGSLALGDVFQLGSGADARLHKVVKAIASSGTMEIFPSLRNSYTAGAAVLTNPKGVFKLSSNQVDWTVDVVTEYGITFAVEEKL